MRRERAGLRGQLGNRGANLFQLTKGFHLERCYLTPCGGRFAWLLKTDTPAAKCGPQMSTKGVQGAGWESSRSSPRLPDRSFVLFVPSLVHIATHPLWKQRLQGGTSEQQMDLFTSFRGQPGDTAFMFTFVRSFSLNLADALISLRCLTSRSRNSWDHNSNNASNKG